jgi:mannose-6-phosphate isomerase-like protein (cupin superfamily)
MTTVATGNSQHYRWGDGCDGWHLLQSPSLHVIEERVPPGKSERRHVHAKAQQFFFILAGRAVLELAGREHALETGQGIEVAPGLPHCFKNPYTEAVTFLVISQPTTRGDRQDLED